MRKIIVGAQVSMDGVMQSARRTDEDPTKGFKFGGWSMAYWSKEGGEEIMRLFNGKFDLLLGRKTYEISRVTGPTIRSAPAGGVAKAFKGGEEVCGFPLGRSRHGLAGSVLLPRHRRREAPEAGKRPEPRHPGPAPSFVHALLANDLVDAISTFHGARRARRRKKAVRRRLGAAYRSS